MTRVRTTVAVCLLVAAAALLASGALYGVTPDDEEYRSGMLSTVLHARALLRGHYLTWTAQLGFGLPQPLGPSFFFHPLMPLLAVVPVDLWVRLLVACHVVLAAVGAWKFGAKVGLSPLGRALVGATFLLSTPSQNYLLTDFWLTPFVSWTVVPWLIYGFLCLAERPPGRGPLLLAAAAGALGGSIVANGHPGYLLVYGPPLLAFLLCHRRAVARDAPAWVLLAVIGLVVAAPTLYYLGQEFLAFPGGLDRFNKGEPLALAELPSVFFRPFARSLTSPLADTHQLGTRTLYFGGPFAALTLIGIGRALTGRGRIDLASAATVSLVLLLTPGLDRIRVFTATFAFRDPLILFAAPLAASVLDAFPPRRLSRLGAHTIALVQVGMLTAAAWPFLQDTWATRTWPVGPGVAITGGTNVTRSLLEATQPAGRTYLSAAAENIVLANRGRLDGFVTNGLAYLGLPVVNGVFKGVSVDGVSPSTSVPYGAIRSQPPVQMDQRLLDLAGIRYVVAVDGEQVAPGLVRGTDVAGTNATFVVWRNPSAAAGAVVVAPAAKSVSLRALPGCDAPSIFCKDFAPVHALVRSDPVNVSREDGRVTLALDAASSSRVVLLWDLFRPEWTPRTAGVSIVPAFGGVMFVDVPAGATEVVLTYRPVVRLVLSGLAWVTVAAVTCVCVAARMASGRRRQAMAGAA